MQVPRFAENTPAGRLFASLGYEYVRTFWMVRMGLESAPPEPRVPDGIRIRTLELGREEELLDVLAERFGLVFPRETRFG